MSDRQNAFSKQMQQKFMKDLQNIDINDQDSQLQASTDFYQGLKKKINNQLFNMRNSTITNTILTQLKTNINKQMNNMQKYQQQFKQIKQINTTTQNVIAQHKIQQIKNKIAQQTINQSKIVLADQKVQFVAKQENNQQQIEEQIIQENNKNHKSSKNINMKKIVKKKQNTININIQRKIQQANLQRERINMEREDQLSMKYQNQVLSQFFKERFLQFKIPKFQYVNRPIKINLNKPKSTFTNLTPLPNHQNYVLPKNAPQIALKSLQKSKKIKLASIKKTTIKIQFKIVQKQQLKPQINSVLNINEKELQCLSSKNSQNILQRYQKFLSPYFNSIKNPLKQLQNNSSFYKPKFIKNHLNENQKISNIDVFDLDNNHQQRSLQSIIEHNQISQQIDFRKFKQFKLTFENITNLKGIQVYQNIQYAALQHNLIKNINSLQYCKKLIQINLSNNKIKDIKNLQCLPWLRYLNISNNKIKQIELSGGSLEILHARHNQIQVIIDLNKNKYLRIIDLSVNKLHDVKKGINLLYFLQELYLSKNYIQDLQGIQSLLMLQKLDLQNNRISKIHIPLIYMFLNVLNISYNQLTTIPQIFLPSLERLYLTNNKISGQGLSKLIIYLPELKQFNLDDNEIKGFSSVWFFVRFSKKLQIVKYDSNQYFLSVRQKVRQLYQAIIYRNMKNIKILNLNPADSGVKAYYQSVYNSYLQNGIKIQTLGQQMNGFEAYIQFLLKQNKIISELENQYSNIRNPRFIETQIFIKSKSVKRAQCLQNLIKILSNSLNLNKQNLKEQQLTLLQINDCIYYHHDKFQHNILKKVHKIKSLFYKLKYKNEKRRKYFENKKSQIINLLTFINKLAIQNGLKKIIKKFQTTLTKNRQQGAALIIQKNWRGFKCRKLFQKLFKNFKNNDDDSFQMQQVDLNDFQKQQFPQFNFDLPEGIDFEEYIIEPKYFQIAADQAKKRPSNNKNHLQKIQEEQHKDYKPVINNYMNEQQKKIQKNKKKQQDQRLMKQWGFQNPASLEALKWKKKRKQEWKKKQALQNMTAAQRLQRFKNMHR